MMKRLMITAVAFAAVTSGRAQELDADKAEYLSHCAQCHGDDAKGSGPRSTKLKTKPADLTTLAGKNNGLFPVRAVYNAIDGRNVSESHSARDMPIWGCRSSPQPAAPAVKSRPKVFRPAPYESHLDLACDPEDVIANRILSVVDYLRRVQEK